MNEIVEELLKTMPASPTELSKVNIKKIQGYLPVPNDFKTLWADITSFSNYPAGVVICDKGIVFKASREALRSKKSNVKSGEDALKIFYRITPWEYFTPDDYSFEKTIIDGKEEYILRSGEVTISFFDNSAVQDFFIGFGKIEDRYFSEAHNVSDSAVFGEVNTLNFEQTAFNAAYGADQSQSGHGIYAEEGGTILDKLNGDQATVVGRDNAKNGPDKLVNGKPVQCKFYKTASSSIQACFKRNPETGLMEYRYIDLRSGKPMQVEVPADQYEKALQSMQNHITKGQVPGVTDPAEAKNLVRKSRLTYAQAKNLAKAGTFESLTFDVTTGTVQCSFAAGVSSLVTFGIVYWKTKDRKKAQDAAIDAAIQVFGPAFAANLIASQIARTGLTNAMIPLSENFANALGSKMVQNIVNAKRALLGQTKISGISATKSFAKALRSTAVSEGVMIVVFSIPDTYKVIANKISGAQYTKNMVSLAASFAGNMAGVYGAGVIVGKIGEAVGKNVNKTVGGVIGFAGGLAGGMLAGSAARVLTGMVKEDDSVITARLINAAISNMAIEYLLSEDEAESLIKLLDDDSKAVGKIQMSLLSSDHQYRDIKKFLEPYFDKAVGKRESITDDEVFTANLGPSFA